MELTTAVGLIVGFVAVIGAMIFKHISFTALLNPAAMFVIFVGTVGCILNAFPGDQVKVIPSLFGILFKKNENNVEKIISTFEELAAKVRRDGLLAIEAEIGNYDDEFLKKGLRMLVDGTNEDYIAEAMAISMEESEERHSINASIFSQAGAYAPTLGVLGAVFGLIAAMRTINDTDKMAEAISAAFIATIFGIFTGYVLWNPFANKLKVKSRQESHEKRMVIEGVLSLARNESPAMIKEKLMAFLSDAEVRKLGGV